MNKEELQHSVLTTLVNYAPDTELRQIDIDTPGMMYVEFGYLEGPVLSDEKTLKYPNAESRYMTNLHEIGHAWHGHTQGRPIELYMEELSDYQIDQYHELETLDYYFRNGILRSEAEAWDFALNQSIIKEYAPETREFMWEACLGSYYRSALRDGLGMPGIPLSNGDRGYVSFVWDRPDNLFNDVKARMLDDGKKLEVEEEDGEVIVRPQIRLEPPINPDAADAVWRPAATFTLNNWNIEYDPEF